MRARLSQKIGLHKLENLTQFKKINGQKQLTESIRNYCGICFMLNMRILLLFTHKYQPPMCVWDKSEKFQPSFTKLGVLFS